MISLSSYLTLGAIMFSISIAGIFLNRKNVVVLLMCIELMLLSANINFVAFSYYLNDVSGQVFVFFSALLLASFSLVTLFRNRSTIDVEQLDAMKG